MKNKLFLFIILIILVLIVVYNNYGKPLNEVLTEGVNTDFDSENIKNMKLQFLYYEYSLDNKTEIKNFINIIKNIIVRKDMGYEIRKRMNNYNNAAKTFHILVTYNPEVMNQINYMYLIDTRYIYIYKMETNVDVRRFEFERYKIIGGYNFEDIRKITENFHIK